MNKILAKKICALQLESPQNSRASCSNRSFAGYLAILLPPVLILLALFCGLGPFGIHTRYRRSFDPNSDTLAPQTLPPNDQVGTQTGIAGTLSDPTDALFGSVNNDTDSMWGSTDHDSDSQWNDSNNKKSNAGNNEAHLSNDGESPLGVSKNKHTCTQKPDKPGSDRPVFTQAANRAVKLINDRLVQTLVTIDRPFLRKLVPPERNGRLPFTPEFAAYLNTSAGDRINASAYDPRFEDALKAMLKRFQLTSANYRLVVKSMGVWPFTNGDRMSVLATVSGMRALTVIDTSGYPQTTRNAYSILLSNLVDDLNRANPNGKTFKIEEGRLDGTHTLLFYETKFTHRIVTGESKVFKEAGFNWPLAKTLTGSLNAGLNHPKTRQLVQGTIGILRRIEPDEIVLDQAASNLTQNKAPWMCEDLLLTASPDITKDEATYWSERLGSFLNNKPLEQAMGNVSFAIEYFDVHDTPIPPKVINVLRTFYNGHLPQTDYETIPGLNRTCFKGCPYRAFMGNLVTMYHTWQLLYEENNNWR